MTKHKLLSSILILISTILLFLSVIFAWFVMTSEPKIESFSISATRSLPRITIEINKNNTEFKKVSTKEEFLILFNNSKPSDQYKFKIVLENDNVNDKYINLRIFNVKNIFSSENESDDLLNYFYINEGKITLRSYNDFNSELFVEKNYILNSNKNDVEIYNQYALNYIKSTHLNKNVVLLLKDELIKGKTKVEVFFDLVYDYQSTIQNINLLIQYIEIY